MPSYFSNHGPKPPRIDTPSRRKESSKLSWFLWGLWVGVVLGWLVYRWGFWYGKQP